MHDTMYVTFAALVYIRTAGYEQRDNEATNYGINKKSWHLVRILMPGFNIRSYVEKRIFW